MKKLILYVLALIFILSATGCNAPTDDTTADAENVTEENSTKESETTTVIGVNYYTGVVFSELKTFDEITGLTYQESDETKTGKTVFKYITFDSATQAINDFKTYLLEYGFKMTSGVNDKTQKFEYEENTLTIESSSGSSGTIISITIPCDEATAEARRVAYYTEAETSFNNGEYKNVLQICNYFTSGLNYKNLLDYYNFSQGVNLYNSGFYASAKECFDDCSENINTEEYLTKINNVFSNLNGTYKKSRNNGTYFIMKDGEWTVTFEESPSVVYYTYELKFLKNADDEIEKIYVTGDPSYWKDRTEIEYDVYYELSKHDTNEWYLIEPGSTADLIVEAGLEGTYTKISSNAP